MDESVIRVIDTHQKAKNDPIFAREDIYLISAVGFCVEDASAFCGRPVDEESENERTLSRAHCDAKRNSPLPSRMLDLHFTSGSDIIRLCDTDGRHGCYITLSHCWGQSGRFTTPRASMELRKQGIRLADLPETFQDAVAIARRLSIRHLWIDSLCICQEDPEDWDQESSKMAAVYANSQLTIAATAAENSAAGSFIRRPVDFVAEGGTKGQLLAFSLPLEKAALSRLYLGMAEEPLSRGACALQERTMAQRVLHCSTDQMYYECNQEFRSEDGFRVQGRYNSLFPGPEPNFVIDPQETRYLAWRVFAACINATYVAGLWSDAIVEGLGWEGRGTYDAISGSDRTDVATVLDYHTSLEGTNPFGRLTNGWVRVRAPLIPLSISDVPDDEAGPGRWRMRLKTPWGDLTGTYARFDYIDRHDEALVQRLMPLFALVLARTEKYVREDDDNVIYKVLIVSACCDGKLAHTAFYDIS
ncbi:heterokaryon incompatibility protein-domain-containing protein [Chaetomium sp. MPI-CAGE-AT-0009]|nr:heterokaryon incompatibility protein-domain-containing protein [Chaetomium sp. MPI-CAGE-AT-0009]